MDSAPKTEPIADVTSTPPNRPSPGANGAVPFDPFLLKVPAPGMGDYHLLTTGNYPGSIVGLIDIGHQPKYGAAPDSGEKVQQVVLVYELVERRPDGKPFLLDKAYTASLHEKATLFKLASCITGKNFHQDEEFSLTKLLGMPVMVNVSNSLSGEKAYHAVESIAAFPKGMQVPRPTYPLFAYSISQGGRFSPPFEVPFIFGQSVETLIRNSPEYKALNPDEIPF
jgi:hypothetical protein